MNISTNTSHHSGVLRILMLTAGTILLLAAYGFVGQSVADEERDRLAFQQFEQLINDFDEQIRTDLAAEKISENEAWARWYNYYFGEFRPKLMAAIDDGEISGAATGKLWPAIETAEFNQRTKASIARGRHTEEEGRQLRETFRKANNPIVFGLFGDLFVLDADEEIGQLLGRFDSEIAARSEEENRRKLNTLIESMRREKEGQGQDHINILALEIRRIYDALGEGPFDIDVLGHVYYLDPSELWTRLVYGRVRREIAERSVDENRREVDRLTKEFREALNGSNEQRLLTVAFELRLVTDSLEEKVD